MSSNAHTATDATSIAHEDDRLESIERRLDALDRENQRLQEENEELREENSELRERVSDLETAVEVTQETVWNLEDTVIGEYDFSHRDVQGESIISRLESLESGELATEKLSELQRELREEQRKRGSDDTKIRRRLSHVEDETGVNPDGAETGDKITEINRNGPGAVTNRVTSKYERAATLIQSGFDDDAGNDWADRVSDSRGKRLVFKSSTVRPLLSEREDGRLQTVQVRRAFETIEDLAADSPRRVKLTKTDDGENRLAVWVGGE